MVGSRGCFLVALVLVACGRPATQETVHVDNGAATLVPSSSHEKIPDVLSGAKGAKASDAAKRPRPKHSEVIRHITAGAKHVCALTTRGQVYCWGRNRHKELGVSGIDETWRPSRVPLLDAAIWVEANDRRTCAVERDGEMVCWGQGRGLSATMPQKQRSMKPVRKLWVGATGSVCALFGDGSHCLSTAKGGDSSTYVARGRNHVCLLFKAGHVECRGATALGQAGRSGPEPSRRFARVAGLKSKIRRLSTGHDHTCTVRRDGRVLCWGSNAHGQLGTPPRVVKRRVAKRSRQRKQPRNFSATPVLVPGVKGAIDVVARYYHTCAILKGGSVRCWGRARYGVLGPKGKTGAVEGVAGVMSLALGRTHTCALTDSGQVWCWGLNDDGQVGSKVRSRAKIPTRVYVGDSS